MVQCLKTTQTSNPFVLIDEIDKLGRGYQVGMGAAGYCGHWQGVAGHLSGAGDFRMRLCLSSLTSFVSSRPRRFHAVSRIQTASRCAADGLDFGNAVLGRPPHFAVMQGDPASGAAGPRAECRDPSQSALLTLAHV